MPSPSFKSVLRCLVFVGMAASPFAAHAVSCTVSAAMSPADRTRLAYAASALGSDIVRGDAAALQAGSAPSLASDFASVAGVVTGLSSGLKGAAVTVESLYALHAADLQTAGADAQFFCSRSDSPLLVTISLGQIPPGEYALAVVYATGVAAPQQFALILRNEAATGAPPTWRLAGLLVRPLTLDGHSGLWFWNEARRMGKTGAPFSAYLYYRTAAQLSRPADLLSSNNSEKLEHEQSAVQPKEVADGDAFTLKGSDGATFSVTALQIDTGLGALDLRVDAGVPTLGDPVTSRATAINLMQALLQKYPEIRANFHGIWAFLTAANGQTFAVEQPMSSLP